MGSYFKISSGAFKGRKISFITSSILRPTSSKLREILFNWIQFEINKSIVLDLFAGTGSLGFEAISRGAAHSTLIEKNKKHYKGINDSIKLLGIEKSCKVYFKDSFEWLKKTETNLSKYDFIFIDPPFSKNFEEKILRILLNEKLKQSCKIYIEHSKFDDIYLSEDFEIIKEREIGNVKALLLKRI